MTHGNSKSRPPAEEIRRLYHDEGLTQRQVAERLGVGYSTIKRWFLDMGIERRVSGWTSQQRQMAAQARREKRQATRHPKAKDRPSADELYRLYHDELLTIQDMADRVGVSRLTMGQWLRDAGIQIRGRRGKAAEILEARRRGDEPTETIIPAPLSPHRERPFHRLDADDLDLVRWHCRELERRAAELRRRS